jgi:hypothetical protein
MSAFKLTRGPGTDTRAVIVITCLLVAAGLLLSAAIKWPLVVGIPFVVICALVMRWAFRPWAPSAISGVEDES